MINFSLDSYMLSEIVPYRNDRSLFPFECVFDFDLVAVFEHGKRGTWSYCVAKSRAGQRRNITLRIFSGINALKSIAV